MTVHYSAYGLNTNCGSDYFRSQLPEGYPLHPTLQKSRAFRRLPPNLKKLGTLANRWVEKHDPDTLGNTRQWYDSAGYELNPVTGDRLTDAEIDAQWDALGDLGLSKFVVQDIPVPTEGFADPDTWEPPEPESNEDLVDRSGLTMAQILSDIKSRGRDATAAEYGLPPQLAAGASTDTGLAHAILAMHGQPWSNY